MNDLNEQMKRLKIGVEKVINVLPAQAGSIAVAHAQDNFNRQQFGSNGIAWKASSTNKSKTLFDTGNLMRSINYKRMGNMKVSIFSDAPYAQLHNEGGKVKITKKMRSFFWYKHKATGLAFWKYLALTKGDYLSFPKRQFMGHHNDIDDTIGEWLDEQMDSLFT